MGGLKKIMKIILVDVGIILSIIAVSYVNNKIQLKRDIDTILDESRQSLLKENIDGPYILAPHSMSGIEALYWAQKYPEEVKAIVGLDMAVPDAYLNYSINMPLLKVSSWAVQAGMTRLIPGVWKSDAVKYGSLSEEEKNIYKSVFYRRTATKTMLNEVEEVKNNALMVSKGGHVDIPMLMFCSNGKGTGYNEEEWRAFQSDYVRSNENGKIVNLDCSHYVHDYEYERIAEDIKSFVKGIS